MNQPRHLNWAGQPVGNWGYGGREENIPVHLSVSQKRAQSLDVFRQLIKKGVNECNQIAEEMGVSKYSVSRMAKRAEKAGWLDNIKQKYVIVNK